MDFAPSARAAELIAAVREFIDAEVMPVERAVLAHHDELLGARAGTTAELWHVPPSWIHSRRKRVLPDCGICFCPIPNWVAGYPTPNNAPLAEQMGRSLFAPTVFNCNAPDSGNMEVLHRYGSQEQKEVWLEPLLEGDIRSAFCMTEPDVASSDATNMAATAVVEGDEVVINGRKWWSTGVGHPDCKVIIFMGLTDPNAHRYARHSMVLVPMDTPGITVERMLPTMGFYDEPGGHGVVSFDNVRLPTDAFIAGPGKGFEIAQGRLGPGRVHHAMRLIGLAEVALEHACRRGLDRTAFGKPLVNLGGNRERIADARIAINQTRLLVLHAAWLLDTVGIMGALSAVSEIKVAAPNMAQQVIDMAIQIHGGGGLSNDFPLAAAWVNARALRLADGPDEVHRGVVARIELAKYAND